MKYENPEGCSSTHFSCVSVQFHTGYCITIELYLYIGCAAYQAQFTVRMVSKHVETFNLKISCFKKKCIYLSICARQVLQRMY